MNSIKRTNPSADTRYDSVFDDKKIHPEARNKMAVSHLSGFTILAMYMDDTYSAHIGESFSEWANSYWRPTDKPVKQEETTIERAMEVFATTMSPEGTIPLADFMIFDQLEQVVQESSQPPIENEVVRTRH